jgi:transposase
MFVRSQRLKGEYRIAVMICHSVRQGKKVSKKTLKYFGVARNEKELAALRGQAQLELRQLKISKLEKLPPPLLWEEAREERRIVEGFHDIFGVIFDRLGLVPLFSRLRYHQLRDVVIARVAMPSSKCRAATLLTQNYSRPLSEDQIYRLMDRVQPHVDTIKGKILEATRHMAQQQKIDLLFFDVTTLYFESQKPDELRDFGYSKDHKIGETQVVLALATTSDGLPIGYSLFSGKTAEVKTLLHCLNEWRKITEIRDVVVIADRAMMSADNLQEMERQNIRYVVAAKLKQFAGKIKTQILARHEESTMQVGEEQIFAKEHTIDGRRLIVSYSNSRALKDRSDRERLLSRLQKKVSGETNPRALVTNRGYLKFLDEKEKGKVVLNEQKIAEDSRWDGLHGIITNDLFSSAEELLARYRQLWVIEESFRINKHTLAMRPIYHFKQERIQVHVLICYLAFALSRYAQQQLKNYGTPMSVESIRHTLSQVEASIVRSRDQVYRMPSKIRTEAGAIYRAFGINRSMKTTLMEGKKCGVTQKIQPVVC